MEYNLNHTVMEPDYKKEVRNNSTNEIGFNDIDNFNYDINNSNSYDCTNNNTVLLATNKKAFIGNVIDVNRYNDYLKLIKVTGYLLRFISNIKSKIAKRPLVLNKYLTTIEIGEARQLWLIDNKTEY